MTDEKVPTIKEMAETMRAISNILVLLEPHSVEMRASILAGVAKMSGVNEFLTRSNPEMEAALGRYLKERRERRERD